MERVGDIHKIPLGWVYEGVLLIPMLSSPIPIFLMPYTVFCGRCLFQVGFSKFNEPTRDSRAAEIR